jgi:pimeloyl-ACP methyl ester carboxylesterase
MNFCTSMGLTFCLSLSATVAFGRPTAVCDSGGLCKLSRTLTTDSGTSREVAYSFRYRAAKAGAPTVVVIPGGPGDTSTDKDIEKLNSIPASFGLIQTDPRFLGVNERSDVVEFRNALTSEGVARDIQLALDSVGVQNPVIYGVSYGTVVATMLAHSLSQTDGMAPRAVVLDGTFAHHETQAAYVSGLLKEWQKFAISVPEADLKAFQELSLKMIRSQVLSPDQMGSAVMAFLMARNQGRLSLIPAILGLSRTAPDRAAQILVDIAKQFEGIAKTPGAKLFHAVVGCRELVPDGHMEKSDLTFTFELRANSDTDCETSLGPAALYDSKSYPIKSSTIIYLNGENDPVTPLAHAEYHAQFQNESKKIQIVVPDAGHGVLIKELSACAENLWRAIASNPADASRQINACLSPLSIQGDLQKSATVVR